MTGTTEIEEKVITKHEFYFETPLYSPIKILPKEFLALIRGDVDAYSAKNFIDTTYSIDFSRVADYSTSDFYEYFKISLTCRRKENDILVFYVTKIDDGYIKVGQYPSLADIQFAEIGKKYDKYLEREDVREYKKAIGLAAHGVGAGSFVYLRRIFEKLILQTFQDNKEKISIEDADFIYQKMEDKIKLIKEYLPEELIEMGGLYGVLSKGVHELSEDVCLEYFPILKLAIELILESKINSEKEKERKEEVKKALNLIVSKSVKSE